MINVKFGKYKNFFSHILYPISVDVIPKRVLLREHWTIHKLWNAYLFPFDAGPLSSSYDYKRWKKYRYALYVRHEQVTNKLISLGCEMKSNLPYSNEIIKNKKARVHWPSFGRSLDKEIWYKYFMFVCAYTEYYLKKVDNSRYRRLGNKYFREEMGATLEKYEQEKKLEREKRKKSKLHDERMRLELGGSDGRSRE